MCGVDCQPVTAEKTVTGRCMPAAELLFEVDNTCGVTRQTMKQLGIMLSEEDVHAMMKSIGVGPHGKISFQGRCIFVYFYCTCGSSG